MKKHLSVFALIARHSVFKVFLILFAMAAAELALFYAELNRAREVFAAGIGYGFGQLEDIIGSARPWWLFAAAFVAVSVFICKTGTEYSSRISYTLNRLQIGEKSIYIWQLLYNLCVYAFLWAVQTAVCFAMGIIYANAAPAEYISEQTVFLAFYRNNFFHSVFPHMDVLMWVRNFLMLAALSLSSADFPMKQRKKKVGASVIALVLFSTVFFVPAEGDHFTVFLAMLVYILNIMWMIYSVKREEVSYEA